VKRFAALFNHPLRLALAAMAAILIVGAAGEMTQPPRADRDWYPYLARTPQVVMNDEMFSVSPVSDWSYFGDAPVSQAYIGADYAFSQLRNVWFMLEPQPGSQLAAHTLLLFEFEGDRLLGLTIEARRERDEDYSAIRGIFNAFELSYIWASARDLLTRRAVMLRHDVFLYPVQIDAERGRRLLRRLLERTNALETEPRYYNTIVSNCTNELAKAAGFHWAPAYIFTGRSDEYLFRRGLLAGESFEAAHARSDITEFVRALNEAPAETFDAALLAEMRRRNGM
jgi:hypothetical protein